MRLKLLAISDTHLGEDTSILTFPHGRQALWRALRDSFGEDKEDPKNPGIKGQFVVDELVLMGDIPDRTLSSTSEVITHTTALADMLGSAARVKKAVYVPGNHDHTIWTAYAERRPPGSPSITSPAGEALVKGGTPVNTGDAVRPLLELFFSYPGGSGWRAVTPDRGLDFAIANPLYATSVNGRTYVLAHGTHFRTLEVTRPVWVKRLLTRLRVDRFFGKIRVNPGGDVRAASTLDELEAAVAPLADTLWPSADNDPTPFLDQTWARLTAERRRYKHRRASPELNAKLFWDEHHGPVPGRMVHLTSPQAPHGSVSAWRRFFLPEMLDHLHESGFCTDHLTFVYGDTHSGGWGEEPRDGGEPIRLYNTGAWAVDDALDHPPCHLFAVLEDGRECMLDVTVRDVQVGQEGLLALAARALEHRRQGIGLGRRAAIALIAWVSSKFPVA